MQKKPKPDETTRELQKKTRREDSFHRFQEELQSGDLYHLSLGPGSMTFVGEHWLNIF